MAGPVLGAGLAELGEGGARRRSVPGAETGPVSGRQLPRLGEGASAGITAEHQAPVAQPHKGMPGPGRAITQGKTTYFCASDPGTVYVPGVGGCP